MVSQVQASQIEAPSSLPAVTSTNSTIANRTSSRMAAYTRRPPPIPEEPVDLKRPHEPLGEITSPDTPGASGSGCAHLEQTTATKAARGMTEWHRDKEEDYKMSSKCRGICLIINNVTFDMNIFPDRKGSDMDAFRFKKIFKQLGFEVDSKRNLNSEKMKNCFKQIAALCMNKHDALVVILLSHGTESGVLGVDNIEVDLNDILTQFDNKHCKQMLGKPKVFIVQACRGRLADYGVREAQTFFSQPESQQQLSQLTQLNSQSSLMIRLPRWTEVDKDYCPTRTDMALCFSSHTGYLSTRNEEDGSWLGASLALHLKLEAHRRHLIEILNMVSRDVRRRRSTDGHKQVLEITTIGFDKNLYFNPGLHD